MSEQIGNGNKELSRREFLKLGTVALLGGLAGGFGGVLLREKLSPKSTSPSTPTETPTPTGTPIPPTSTEMVPTPIVKVTEQAEQKLTPDIKIISGVPTMVSRNDLIWANETVLPNGVKFNNPIGNNTDWVFAEPGVLTAESAEDCGDNPHCWVLTGGHQEILTDEKTHWPLLNNGFTYLSAGAMMVEIKNPNKPGNNIVIWMPYIPKNDWHVYIKNPVGTDGSLIISRYEPGFGQVSMLPPGLFISALQVAQNAAHSLKTNCGNGCESVRLVLIDSNTGAVTEAKARFDSNGNLVINSGWTNIK